MPESDPVTLPDHPIEPTSDYPNTADSMPWPDSAYPDSGPTTRPPRTRRPPAKLFDYHCFLSAMLSLHEPSSYREASADPLWQKAMDDELATLKQTHT